MPGRVFQLNDSIDRIFKVEFSKWIEGKILVVGEVATVFIYYGIGIKDVL